MPAANKAPIHDRGSLQLALTATKVAVIIRDRVSIIRDRGSIAMADSGTSHFRTSGADLCQQEPAQRILSVDYGEEDFVLEMRDNPRFQRMAAGSRDRATVLAAVQWLGSLLHLARPEFLDDEEIVTTAVRGDGMMLQFAHPRLRGKREVVAAAVAQTGEALCYAMEGLSYDPDLVELAIVYSPWVYSQLPTDIHGGSKRLRRRFRDAEALGRQLQAGVATPPVEGHYTEEEIGIANEGLVDFLQGGQGYVYDGI